VKVGGIVLDEGKRYSHFAESREKGFNDGGLIIDDSKESGVMVIEFDTSTQSGLGVDGQFINQEKDNAFKVEWVDICFCKHF
jgi:hypothetical protein